MKQSIHAKRMARAHKRAAGVPKLNLVSLMDIFTILVFFLLVNSSDVEVLQQSKDIELPESVAEQKPQTTLVVFVSENDILVGGRKIADTQPELTNTDPEIKLLRDELEYLASRKPFETPEEQQKGRDITIQADSKLPYTLLKKVMATCAKSGYRNISLAVSQIPVDVSAEDLIEQPSSAVEG